MNIRKRMEHLAPTISVSGLAAAAALHAAWGFGSTWPAQTPRDLARLVVGGDTFPSPSECAAVALLLTGAAGCVLINASRSPARPSSHGADTRQLIRRAARLGTQITAGALLLRGVGGVIVEVFALIPSTEQFRRWDLLLYSPLCIALGAGASLGVIRSSQT
jgi:hypothetical protein